jgi:polynucleotide 5'-kinase involved in rRNA processing
MEDAFGFTLGLGIVLQIDRRYRQVTLHSPLPSLDGVDAIRLSDVTVDPATFEDRHLP